MRTLIIHNPSSGFGSDAVFEFERMLLEAGDECLMRIAEVPLDTAALVRDARDFDIVVISGGDGTVSALMYELRGSNVPICVFPSGTANLISANIGFTPEPAALAHACRQGVSVDLDMAEMRWRDASGAIKSQGFALMSGTGFDAQLMRAAVPAKAMLGQAAYFAAVLENTHPAIERFTITVDGTTHEREGICCLIANTAMIQGDIQIVPDCRMDDGMIDAIVLETTDAAQLLKPLFAGLLDRTGRSLGRPHLETFHGREISVQSAHPLPLEIDGEPLGDDIRSYSARSLPGAVRVIIDSMSPYYPRA